MLNTRALTEILSNNTDGRLCKRWLLMTRNGTLLAYTQSANIKVLRKQAALATLSWHEYQDSSASITADTNGEPGNAATSGSLHTLTVESEASNLIIRGVQAHLLLVLEGNIPPRKHTFELRAIPEGLDDAPYQGQNGNTESSLGSSVSSSADATQSSPSILALQRQKLDALAAKIAEGLGGTGFKIPDEGSNKVF